MSSIVIAVIEFILSVITGFLFGFLGIEYLVGTLDFGFRLLLGNMFGLTVALYNLSHLAEIVVAYSGTAVVDKKSM